MGISRTRMPEAGKTALPIPLAGVLGCRSILIWFRRMTPAVNPSFPANESDVLETAGRWLAGGHGVALATVVRTSGSAPRQTGSHIAVRDDGLFAGSVSAGCVEGAIIEESLAALKDGRHRSLTFGVSDDGVMSTGLLCGGEIEILVEPIA
jgi:hypothetical protein